MELVDIQRTELKNASLSRIFVGGLKSKGFFFSTNKLVDKRGGGDMRLMCLKQRSISSS